MGLEICGYAPGGGAHSQKWMLEWLKMSASALRLWKHWGLSTMPTSSPPSIMGIIFMKKVGSAICKGATDAGFVPAFAELQTCT
jgi:hypothetical protein